MNGKGRTGREILAWVMNPWILGGALVVALILLAVTLSLLWYTRPEQQASGQSTAVLNVIPGPSATPAISSPTASASQAAPTAPPDTGAEGGIRVGASVEVSGTGGDGLRLRADPGLEGEILLLGSEGETFVVQEGPREIDGYTWWYLESADDATRKGWGVADFLSASPGP